MPGKTLIRGVNWVGDAVMTLPAIRAIGKSGAEKPSLLVKPWVAPLFEKNPYISDIILYEEGFRGIAGKRRLARMLREKRFSRAVLLQNAFDAALITFLAGIPERIGYGRDGRGLLLTKSIPYKDEDRKMHHINYYLELLKRAGFDAPYSDPRVFLSLDERLRARETLKDLKRPVVGINPGAAYGRAKEWLPERFKETCKRIIEDIGGSAVVFGGAKPPKKTKWKIRGTPPHAADPFASIEASNEPGRFLSLAGRTTLRELSALISECDVLLSNDSGPMHIGYALKTPLVAIFGSTDPSLTGPVGNGNIVLRKDIACSPCFERQCRVAPGALPPKCMEAITAGETLDALKKLLPRNRAVFFDRDGTLCEDANYLNGWDKFKVFPEINNLNSLKKNGFLLVGVTNQSGIARGVVDEAFARAANEVFVKKHGFDDFYFCPHHPEEHCPCRKPEPEMLLRARLEHSLDLKGSFVVGDKESDMLLARAVGAGAVQVLTGRAERSSQADFVAKDLKEAVDWILKKA